jgi:hypothetical protein
MKMASLTRPQAEILLWMGDSGVESYVAEATLQGPTILNAVGSSVPNREVNGSDFRELEHQRFIRPTTGHGYDLTNEGRAAYQELKSPPREPNPIGFGSS